MNSVEERLREALRAHAEEFTAHPNAWRQLTARRRPRWWWSRVSRSALIPLAAAAAVLAVIAAAILVVHGVSGGAGKTPETGVTATPTARPVSPSASPGADQPPGGPTSGPGGEMLTADPPLSAVVGTDQTIMVGEAVARVASVTAVLSDGRTYPGVVTTGRGLPGTVWAVSYPWSAGVAFTRGAHLVFRDASGKQVTVLDPQAPVGPPQTAQPASGGVALFSYPASSGEPAGTVQAYLVHGEAGFWSRIWGGTISQRLAAGAPALGGLTEPFGAQADGTFTRLEALGYAHANVARVVLRADGRQVASTATLAAGWPGSSLRLWHVSLRLDAQQAASGRSVITATAYDAAGHVLGQVRLGQML